jgi:hypothetical protein
MVKVKLLKSSEPKRYAIVENEKVTNIVLWDGVSKIDNETKLNMVEIKDQFVDIGYSYVKKKFFAGEQEEILVEVSVEQQLENLQEKIDRLEKIVESLSIQEGEKV